MVNKNFVEWDRISDLQIHAPSGLEFEDWRQLRDEVLQRDRFTCQRCRRKFRYKKKFIVHHLIPRQKGGSNELSNLITLCHACHDSYGLNDLRNRI